MWSKKLILFPLGLLFIKHLIADFILQTDKMATRKGKEAKILFLHASHHAILTFFILVFFTSLKYALILSSSEILTHSLIDFTKANKKILGRYTPSSKMFWISFGFDQLLHYLNYLIFIFII